MSDGVVFGSWGDDPRPPESEIAQAAAALRFEFQPADRMPIGLRGLLEIWQEIAVDGGSLSATFAITDVRPAAEWCFRNGRIEQLDLTRRLLASAAMIEALPNHSADSTILREATFTELHPLRLEGDIAVTLVHGGAHRSFPGTTGQAKAVATEATDAMIGTRFDDVRISATYDGWAPWFGQVAWDRTWIITDVKTRRVAVIALTDTD